MATTKYEVKPGTSMSRDDAKDQGYRYSEKYDSYSKKVSSSTSTAAPVKPAQGRGSSSSTSRPTAQPQYDLETKPLDSMTPKEAKEQGFKRSGAVGYYRAPATRKNIIKAQKHYVSQRERVSQLLSDEMKSSGEGKTYHVGKEEVTRMQYLNYLAENKQRMAQEIKSLGDMEVAQAAHSRAIRKPITKNVIAEREIQVMTPDALKKLGRQSEIHGKHRDIIEKVNEGSVLMQGTVTKPYIPQEKVVKAYGVHRDAIPEGEFVAVTPEGDEVRLSRVSQLSIKTSKALLRKAEETDEYIDQLITAPKDTLAHGAVRGISKGFIGGSIVIAAAAAAVPAFVETTIRAPSSTIAGSKKGLTELGPAMYEHATTKPAEFVGGIAGVVVGGRIAGKAAGKVGGKIKAKVAAPESKVTAFKTMEPEVLKIQDKNVKFSGGYEGVLETTTKIKKALRKPPVQETVGISVEGGGKVTPKSFDVDFTTRVGQESVAPSKIKGTTKTVTRKTDAVQSIEKPLEGKKTVELGRETIKTDMEIYPGEYTDTAAVIKGKGGHKKTAISKMQFLKETKTKQIGKARITEETVMHKTRVVDDALNQQFIPEGNIKIQTLEIGTTKQVRGRSTAQRGGVTSGFDATHRPAQITRAMTPEQNIMKPLVFDDAIGKGTVQRVKHFDIAKDAPVAPKGAGSAIRQIESGKGTKQKMRDVEIYDTYEAQTPMMRQAHGVHEAGQTAARMRLTEVAAQRNIQATGRMRMNARRTERAGQGVGLVSSIMRGVRERMRDVTMGGSAQRQRDRPKQTGKPYASTQLPELPVFMQQPQRQRDLTIQHTDQITMQMPKPMQTTIQKPKVPPEIILSNIQPPPIVDPRIHKPKIPLIGFGGGSGTSLTSQREGLHTRLKVIKHNIADIQKLI
jgi:hypothetical protein